MFVESPCFDDPNNILAMEMELQNQLNLEIEMQVTDRNQHLIHEIVHEMSNFNDDYQTHYTPTDHILQPATHDSLYGLLSLPKCSPSSMMSPISLSNGVVYDPLLFPLSLPPQPQLPLLKELFGCGGYAFGGAISGPLFGYQDCNNGVFEMSGQGMVFISSKNKDGKDVKTEKDRRVLMNDKYQSLGSLIPSPTKNDRASIVKNLVEEKRCTRERHKRSKTGNEEDLYEGNDSNFVGDMDQNSSIKSSWIHKKTQNTEVDVRIVSDEVTVKRVQQKDINCLLLASRALDQLQLDIHHIVGGLTGNYYNFLFNFKICEGSLVFASALAQKLIGIVDSYYGANSPTRSN